MIHLLLLNVISFYLQAYDAETKEFHDPPSQARNIRSKGKVCDSRFVARNISDMFTDIPDN